jgi:ATP:cob(I)alamin adenosyltransferase
MKVYTRTGDKGLTGNGLVDQANSFIGVLRSKLDEDHPWQKGLFKIQTDIMDMMSHIATHSSMREKNEVHRPTDGETYCEQWIDEMLNEMPKPHDWFILPGGNEISALCHVIRTEMRTAERRLFTLHKEDPVEEFILKYINRLSDLFFVMARFELYKANISEEKLRPFRRVRK